MPEWINSLRPHAHQIAQAEDLFGSGAPRSTVRLSDNGVVPLAVDAALPGKIFQTIDADQTFDKYFD
jgi:hypothetical protein